MNVDGTTWAVPKSNYEGQKKYHALRKAQRIDQQKGAGGASTAGAVAPRRTDSGEERVAKRAHLSIAVAAHCSRHCETCFTAQECLRDEIFSARASMFIFPSSQVLGKGTERAGVAAAGKPAGADVDAAEGAAHRKAASRTEV